MAEAVNSSVAGNAENDDTDGVVLCLGAFVSHFFQHLGSYVARKPLRVITMATVAVGCMIGKEV